MPIYPFLILLAGLAAVVGMITLLRAPAFLALVTAAVLVSLLLPGEPEEKIARVAEAFGTTAGKIGIVIALAAVIGKCSMDSGAADRIVRSLLRTLGEKRTPEALATTAFVLAPPVFFNTAFYLLVPLARSFWKQTQKNYVLYLLAIGAGGVVTHVLVPPAAGPLLMAANLRVEAGVLVVVGILVGIPTAAAGLLASRWLNRRMDIPARPYPGETPPPRRPDHELPGLLLSLTPIVLPVVLISAHTVTKMLSNSPLLTRYVDLRACAGVTAVFGNVNLALLLAAAIAMLLLARQHRLRPSQLAKAVEEALMNAGVMILIIAAGGAFGAMLAEARVGDAVQGLFAVDGQTSGMAKLWIAFGMAVLLKSVQGSSTVAMISTSAILATMDATAASLGFHPVYLATAIGAGSLVVSWMNDAGFWVVSRMGNLTEAETLRSWTVMIAVVGLCGMGFTVLAAWLVPLASC